MDPLVNPYRIPVWARMLAGSAVGILLGAVGATPEDALESLLVGAVLGAGIVYAHHWLGRFEFPSSSEFRRVYFAVCIGWAIVGAWSLDRGEMTAAGFAGLLMALAGIAGVVVYLD